MRASRGGNGSARSLRPSSVMRPCASIAPSSCSNAFASAERGLRRRIEERQLAGIAGAPLRQIEHEGRQIGRENFRPRIGLERAGLRLVPQPVADARLGAAGAAAALVGGGARDAHGFQPRQADIRLVARHARQAAVDDDAHAFDGERGFRNRGRQHHLAAARRRRRNGAILLARIERAVKRDDVDGFVGDALLEQRLGAADFAPRPAGTPAASRSRRASARSTASATWLLDARARDRGRDSASRPERRGPRFRPPARRRAAPRRARRRASPTSPGFSGPRAGPAARRAPAPARDRHRASVHGIRRTARRRCRRARDRRAPAA